MKLEDLWKIRDHLMAIATRNHGDLLELSTALHSYLFTLVGEGDRLAVSDFHDLTEGFPEMEDGTAFDSMTCGVHYQIDSDEKYKDTPEGFFDDYEETPFEEYLRKITSDTKHLGGALPRDWAIVWDATTLAGHQWKLLSDNEYAKLKALIPEIKNNPVDQIRTVTQKQRLE